MRVAVTGEQSEASSANPARAPQPPSQIKNIDLHDSPRGTKRYLTRMRRPIHRTSRDRMESLASRTNVASLRAGSATRPGFLAPQPRARRPVERPRAPGANDDGNEANKTSTRRGRCVAKKTETPNPDPGAATSRGTHRDGSGARRSAAAPVPRAPRSHPASSRAARAALFSRPAPNRFG